MESKIRNISSTSALMLLLAIVSIPFNFGMIVLENVAGGGVDRGILSVALYLLIAKGAILIIASIGLYKLQRWGFFLLFATCLLFFALVVYLALANPAELSRLYTIELAIDLLFLLYFWKNFKYLK